MNITKRRIRELLLGDQYNELAQKKDEFLQNDSRL